MIAGKQPILLLNQSWSCAVTQITDQLNAAGYAVVKTFDLLSALAKYSNRILQMVILLVYGQDGPPATLIVEGNDSSTAIFLENDPEQLPQSQFVPLLFKLSVIDQPPVDYPDETIDHSNDPLAYLHDK